LITLDRDYEVRDRPARLARGLRAYQMLRYLWDCYQQMDSAAEANEIHVCSLLAFIPIWWWQLQQARRRTLVLYARRTELAALSRGPRTALAAFALRRADLIVVEDSELKEFVCRRLGARASRVSTVVGLTREAAKSRLSALYMHPERRALFDLCEGRGIDVGCGSNKTHPGAIGVDLTPKGVQGQHGNQRLQLSEAEIVSPGDDLSVFDDNSLDYVVERHNLEHYLDPVNALLEWRRVLRVGGALGMVVPDDAAVDTIPLDPTHKHAFTMDSLARLISVVEGFEIVTNRVCIPGWSFVLIARKTRSC
jgi:SAM-dependent methyltransferase